MPDAPIEELEARLEAAQEPKARIDALNDLAWVLRHNGAERGSELAREARQRSVELGYALGQARAARTMALCLSGTGDVNRVFRLAEEARRMFDVAGDPTGRAASRDFLASLHEFIGDLAGGLELALDALRIAREAGDSVRQGYALANVGGILAESGEVEEGIERLQEALVLFDEAGDPTGAGAICTRLAEISKKEGRNEEARRYAERCLEIGEAAERPTPYVIPYARLVLAQLHEDAGELDQAAALYRAAFEPVAGLTAASIIGAKAKVGLGKLLAKRGELDAAKVELDEALRLTDGVIVSVVVATAAHEALADLHQQSGQHAATVTHLREAWRLREQMLEREARNRLAQVEGRAAIESAQKDAEIHRLRFVELHGMQAKLVESERMALLGRLAAGTAHELNTPLGVLRSDAAVMAGAAAKLVRLLGDAPDLGPRAQKLVRVIESTRESHERALERVAAIADSFDRFSHLDRAERRAFDVRECLESAAALLAPMLPERVEWESRLSEVPAIDAWPRELSHAFLTVLENAVQAIDEAGVVTVETSHTDEHVIVRVRDTGRGMSEEQVSGLFDVSFAEQGERVRLRLGLSAAYATMDKHGGTLEVESALGRGTSVTFRFPVA